MILNEKSLKQNCIKFKSLKELTRNHCRIAEKENKFTAFGNGSRNNCRSGGSKNELEEEVR